ncbi:hypothetical protein BRD16_00280 [Halobacteriales archaeon SW_6_65_46]|nr:MAG: hypothetical protein BRD16_00280 [Halobacteriales archaeon SW_6_65_46]
MTHPYAIATLKTVTLALGIVITYYSVKAYRRTDAEPLAALALGFGIITMGAFTAGVLDWFAPVSRELALLVESGFTALGFGTIFYALFVDRS